MKDQREEKKEKEGQGVRREGVRVQCMRRKYIAGRVEDKIKQSTEGCVSCVRVHTEGSLEKCREVRVCGGGKDES